MGTSGELATLCFQISFPGACFRIHASSAPLKPGDTSIGPCQVPAPPSTTGGSGANSSHRDLPARGLTATQWSSSLLHHHTSHGV